MSYGYLTDTPDGRLLAKRFLASDPEGIVPRHDCQRCHMPYRPVRKVQRYCSKACSRHGGRAARSRSSQIVMGRVHR